MKILGVDPGLRITGYGIVDFDGAKIRLVEAGTIEPKEKDLIQNRISKIYKNLDDIIKEHKPDIMVLEKLYTHYHHPVTACVLGHVRGVICLLSAQRNIRLIEQGVRKIRQSVTGKGAASKLQTQGMVAHVLGIDQKKLTIDAGDALALALGFIHLNRNKL